MDPYKKSIRFYSDDRVAVMTLDCELCGGLSPRAASFYLNISEAYRTAVADKYNKWALAAYENSADSRKRYRYTPKRAGFFVRDEGGGVVILKMSAEGVGTVSEKHIWRGDILIKRERL